MIKIDNEFLTSVGLDDLVADHKRVVLKQIYDTLQARVGITLAGRMTDAQLEEFEQYFDAKDDKGAFGWLEQNFPDYKRIVNETLEHLRAEIISDEREVRIALEEFASVKATGELGLDGPEVAQGEH